MQYSKLALLAATMASLASAQLSGIPTCALNPAITALGATNCGTDIKCACSDTAFINSLTPAIQAACHGADLQTAITAAIKLCASVGVTLNLPGVTTTSAAAAPPAPTSAAPKPTTSAAAPPAPSSSAAAAPPPSSSAAGTTAVVPVSTAPAKTTMTTMCPSVTPSASANATTVSVTAPSTTIAFANGAQIVGAQAMGFVGAAAAAVAYFAL